MAKGDEIAAQAAEGGMQYGALCWRHRRGRVQVLLITSRDTGRWVIPKGWPISGLSPAAAAAREAWEEAGVQGEVANEGLGSFGYRKVLASKAALPCEVQVFGLRVARLKDKFPERDERRRKWFSAIKAARKVAEPELRALLLSLDDRLGHDGPSPDDGGSSSPPVAA